METKYLVMWLEAPLQSFGDEHKIYVRSTSQFPRRSALWGMIFSAAGWYDEQRDRLARLRSCSVTVYGYGEENPVLSDYQILGGGWDLSDPWQERMVPHKRDGKPVMGVPPTRPVIKQYLQDVVFAAVCEFPADWESELRAACACPKDVIFLGRKACVPTVPILQGIAADWSEAMKILEHVEKKRNETSEYPVCRQRVYEETHDQRKARWHLQDVPVAFRPAYEYAWRYVSVRSL